LHQRKTTTCTKTAILKWTGYAQERRENQKLTQNKWSPRSEGHLHRLVLLFIFKQEQNEMVSKGSNDIQERLQKIRLIHGIHLIQIITSTQLREMIELEMTENHKLGQLTNRKLANQFTKHKTYTNMC
jgi:hypothetical protein